MGFLKREIKGDKILYSYFVLSCCIGAIVYLAAQQEYDLPRYIRFYLNDFLIIPIVLTICLFSIRFLKKDERFTIAKVYILYLCVCYAIFFEWYMPKHTERYTQDLVDVLLYFSGGTVYYLLQRNTNNK